jgi:hypothetical protein
MRVIFDFARQQVGIEGDGPELVQILGIVREIAPNLPSINIVANQTPVALDRGTSNGHRAETIGNSSTKTLRQFAKSIPLKSVYERITAIAHYQNQYGGRPTFSPKEMGEWFVQCGFTKPSQMPVAFFDCRRRYGYIESASHGSWRITTNGENLIVGLLENGSNGEED